MVDKYVWEPTLLFIRVGEQTNDKTMYNMSKKF